MAIVGGRVRLKLRSASTGRFMKTIRVHPHCGPDVLQYYDLPVPTPGPGQALIRIQAAGVNFIDIYRRTGLYKIELPHTLGQEGAGQVESLGPGVSGIAVGDRVVFT